MHFFLELVIGKWIAIFFQIKLKKTNWYEIYDSFFKIEKTRVCDGKVDSLALQKFLLATDLLQDSIQENLDMIVTDGGFNNASIRQVLDTKFPSIMKNQIR